jgi:hypothetical protein
VIGGRHDLLLRRLERKMLKIRRLVTNSFERKPPELCPAPVPQFATSDH